MDPNSKGETVLDLLCTVNNVFGYVLYMFGYCVF